jgi:glutathione S-transferase
MLTVHHLGISQSERIVWLCEELELSYRLQRYERDPVTRLAPAEYKALHPFGTAPVITDDNLVLAESGAIIEYILARHGRGRLVVTPDRPEFTDYLFWFHFANGSMLPSMVVAADIIMLFPLTTMRVFVPRDLAPYPNIRAYLGRIGARAAYQQAMRKAEPTLTPLLT